MRRKHMQSYWKEMVAEQAALKKENDQATGPKTKAKKGSKPGAEVKAETEGAIEDEQEFETEDRKSLWKSADELFHQYRYPALALTLPILLICLLAALGGSDDRPNRVPVSGRVVIDGKPLTSGTIIFIPEDGAHASIGTIDENGRFTLTCYDGNDGAVPGIHRMEIAMSRVPEEDAPPWPVPRKYSNHQTSELTTEITEPTRDLLVELEMEREHSEGETGPEPSQLPLEGEKK